jgi:serine protease Do
VEGIGFAIPISTAKPIVDELVEKGYVSGRPAFGFTVEVLSAQMRLFYDLPGCLYIRSVEEASDAYAKGIQQGDLICAIDGTEVSTMDEFNTIKNQFSAGDTVTLTIYRKGEQWDVDIQLMDKADLD